MDSNWRTLGEILAPSLIALAAVDEFGSIAAAADDLQLSPSTLGRRMARLEAELGLILLERDGRRLRLSEQARALAGAARRALKELAVVDPRSQDATSGASVRLGLIRTLGVSIVPDALAGFRARHPDVHLELLQASTTELCERLVQGSIDLAFVTPAPEDSTLANTEVMRHRLEVVIPKEHRLAGADGLDIADLVCEPLILLQPEYGTRMVVDRLAAKRNVALSVALETDDTDMARGLAAAGLGVAVVPHVGHYHQPDVDVQPILDPDAFRSVWLVWPSGPVSATVSRLRTHLLRHLSDGTAAYDEA